MEFFETEFLEKQKNQNTAQKAKYYAQFVH